MSCTGADVFDNLRVLEFGQFLAGPVAGMLLADLGADVIKVERPGGDPARDLPAYHTWNRGKRIVETDLRSAEGRGRARELVAGADVVIDGLRPGVLDAAGLGADALLQERQTLIYCSLPGFAPETQPDGAAAWEPIVGAAAGMFRPAAAGDGAV